MTASNQHRLLQIGTDSEIVHTDLHSTKFLVCRTEYDTMILASLTPSQVLSGQQLTRLVQFDLFSIQHLSYNMLEDGSIYLQSVHIEDPDYNDDILDAFTKINFLFNVSVNLTVKHGALDFDTDICSVMPPMFPSTLQYLMKDDALVSWGVQCAAFYGDPLISQWANTSSALRLTKCPPKWIGFNTESVLYNCCFAYNKI